MFEHYLNIFITTVFIENIALSQRILLLSKIGKMLVSFSFLEIKIILLIKSYFLFAVMDYGELFLVIYLLKKTLIL